MIFDRSAGNHSSRSNRLPMSAMDRSPVLSPPLSPSPAALSSSAPSSPALGHFPAGFDALVPPLGPPLEPTVTRLRICRQRRLDRGWDSFAQRCSGSFLGSQNYISALRGTHRVMLFDFIGEAGKIGQCAVARARFGADRAWVFLDSIMLLPDAAGQWPAAMRLVLQTIGAGRYRYGSGWSLMPSCEAALHACEGVTVVDSDTCLTHVVDFAAWADWPSFFAALSSNAKRNAAKAVKCDPTLRVIRHVGWRALRYAPLLYRMQRAMHQRKATNYGWRDGFYFLRRMVLLHRYVALDLVKYLGRYTAFTLSLNYGKQVYYVHGASTTDNGGSAWHLMIALLHATQRAAGSGGRFIMGYDQAQQRIRWPGWENVIRQRQQCRTVAAPTAIVTFDWRPTQWQPNPWQPAPWQST
jgi:hypothetical protein